MTPEQQKRENFFAELNKKMFPLQLAIAKSLPDSMFRPAIGAALDKIGDLYGIKRDGRNDRRFRAALKRFVARKQFSPELKSKNNFVRMWRYLFNPNSCWACGSFEGVHIVLDTMEMGESRIPCEAEHRCGECGELHSQMSYSDWWPRIPMKLMGRIKYLQDELSYGSSDVGVICH